MLEEVFLSLDPDGTMSVEDFFYGLFKTGKSLTPSASTPYRQLKRHLSMQVRDQRSEPGVVAHTHDLQHSGQRGEQNTSWRLAWATW